MAYLAVIGSHKVNGVAELHSGLVKEMYVFEVLSAVVVVC